MRNAFTIRPRSESDEPTLAWLAALAAQPALRRPALIGDVDGMPAAAISLVDGRVVADPFRPRPGSPPTCGCTAPAGGPATGATPCARSCAPRCRS